MKVYRGWWLLLCGGLALVGAGMAFTRPVFGMLVLFACAAISVGVVTINLVLADAENVPLRKVMSLAVKRSLAGGTAAVTFVGLTALFSAWAFLLVAFLAGCSPYALRRYGRWWGERPDWPGPLRRMDPTAHTYAPGAEESPALESHAELRSLSDTDLCRAWRASYSALQDSPSQSERISLVDARQTYLDEFERRNRDGFMAWLASGARAAANPSRFVMGSAGLCHRPIDWDELIPRQDR